MAEENEENRGKSESLRKFTDSMHDIEENIHLMEEKNKDIARMQQKVKCGANQQQTDKDKKTLNEMRESHVAAGKELKEDLKRLLDQLNNEEVSAQREQISLLDENNETYIKRAKLMENYKRFLDMWTTFHRQQIDYRDSMKVLLKTRYKVINENASDEDIEELLDTTKDKHTKYIKNDSAMKKEEAEEIKNRCAELKQLETFIGDSHNLLVHLESLLTSQGEVEETNESSETCQERVKRVFDTKNCNFFYLGKKKTYCIIGGVLLVFLIILIAAVGSSGSEKPFPTPRPPIPIPFTEPTIAPDRR